MLDIPNKVPYYCNVMIDSLLTQKDKTMNSEIERTQKMIEIEVQSLNDEILMGQCFLRNLGNRLQKELTSLNEEDDILTDEVHIQSIANSIVDQCHQIRESKAKREMLFVLTEIMNSETVSQ